MLAIALFSAGATYYVVDPPDNIDDARKAILAEYVNAYCGWDRRQHSPDFLHAQSALMSRLTIKAGLGEIALVEYAKCKIWIN